MVTSLGAEVFFNLFISLCAAFIFGEIAERLKGDAVIGYLTAGIIFGPSVLKIVDPLSIEAFATLGVVLLMFLAGLKEKDPHELYKSKRPIVFGLSLFILSFITLFFIFKYGFSFFGLTYTAFQSFLIALAFSIVDVGMPVKLLLRHELLDTKFGRFILNSAIINVIFGLLSLIVMIIILSILAPVGGKETLMTKIFLLCGFVICFYLLFKFLGKLSRYIMFLKVEEAEFAISFIVVLLMAYMTEAIGISAILGSFLAGLIISRGTFAETRVYTEKIRAISLGVFDPLFFFWFGTSIAFLGADGILENIHYAFLFFLVIIIVRYFYGTIIAKFLNVKARGIMVSSMLSLDVETLVVLLLAVRYAFNGNTKILAIFFPSVLLTTLLITLLYHHFLKKEEHLIEHEQI